MTAEIIHFSEAQLKKYGMGFMLCPRCKDQTCFLPIVEMNGKGLFVSALQCVGPNCEGTPDGNSETTTTINIINGYIQGADL